MNDIDALRRRYQETGDPIDFHALVAAALTMAHTPDPLEPEPDDEPDDDVSRFVDQKAGEALRGLASAFLIMLAVVMGLIAWLAESAPERAAAIVLCGGCVFALYGIGARR
jgi:hypothetical protein